MVPPEGKIRQKKISVRRDAISLRFSFSIFRVWISPFDKTFLFFRSRVVPRNGSGGGLPEGNCPGLFIACPPPAKINLLEIETFHATMRIISFAPGDRSSPNPGAQRELRAKEP